MLEWTRWLAVSFIVVLLDQASKLQIVHALTEQGEVVLAPVFSLVLFYNEGAAFSFLNDAGGWQRGFFMLIAAAASVLILYLLKKHRGEILYSFALSLILGGALGNLLDRIRIGHVVDFMDFHIAHHHFPAFNLADSAITLGAALLILESMRKGKS
ncbi:MAG: signal peptidase II [Burkholderiales bacterium]|nr:signal peptidase II [Burkholderiales bacterium]